MRKGRKVKKSPERIAENMQTESIHIHKIPAVVFGKKSERVYLYIHGQGGRKEEAETFARVACPRGWQILSIDLPEHGERREEKNSFYPWYIVPELLSVMEYVKSRWTEIGLFANSIGAWFSLLSFSGESLKQSLFVSPVLDMSKLIADRMRLFGVSEERLAAERVILVPFGQALSREYKEYAEKNKIVRWECPTEILYAGKDEISDRGTVEAFARKFHCGLTVWDEGEHWFHTRRQLKVLSEWAEKRIKGEKRQTDGKFPKENGGEE